jgi:hypothetical protein
MTVRRLLADTGAGDSDSEFDLILEEMTAFCAEAVPSAQFCLAARIEGLIRPTIFE